VKGRAVLLAALAAVLLGSDRPAPPWEKQARASAGRDLYRANCVVCHDIDNRENRKKKFGPSFYKLFQKPQMPIAKAKPSRQYILIRVQFGGPLMPAFRGKLSPDQINAIIDYIEAPK